VKSLAHLMTKDELPSDDVVLHPQVLTKYVAAIEDASRPTLNVRWTDTSAVTVSGPVPEGHVIALQVSADPGWRAKQDGREIPVEEDRLGFIVLHPSPSPSTQIELQYHGTLEQRIMAVVSIMAWVGAFAGLFLSSAKRTARGQMVSGKIDPVRSLQ